MTNHWAIAVGIDHYQFLQPLQFAQRDAQAVCECLVSEAGFLPDRCLSFTDSSPEVLNRSTYPSRGNLQGWLAFLKKELVQSEDWVWCFFSGYGVCWQGQDYLMPIEGDPTKISETGIPISALFDSLKNLPTDRILVFLDINRSQAAVSGEKLGVQTVALATEAGIATIVSCQPDQFSHEAPALGHGLFTAALLEGLRSRQCSTLANLEDFLKERLPELCDHNDRPAQDPVLVITSPHQLYQVTTPIDWAEMEAWNGLEENPFEVDGEFFDLPINESDIATEPLAAPAKLQPVAASTGFQESGSPRQDLPVEDPVSRYPSVPRRPDLAPAEAPTPLPAPTHQRVMPHEESEIPDQMFWERLLFGGGAILLVLLLGVLFRNWSTFTGQQTASNSSQPGAVTSPPVKPSKPSASKPDGNSKSAPLNSKSGAVAPQAPKEAAPTIASQNSQAKPANGRGVKPSPAKAPSPEDAQSILNEARALIKPVLASDANKAIERARQVPANDPLYTQAQQEIDRWSRDILDIARKRAGERSYKQAIAAAQLVPKDRPQIYAEAQKAIAEWQKRLR